MGDLYGMLTAPQDLEEKLVTWSHAFEYCFRMVFVNSLRTFGGMVLHSRQLEFALVSDIFSILYDENRDHIARVVFLFHDGLGASVCLVGFGFSHIQTIQKKGIWDEAYDQIALE
jgi:hypothetical protein